jgi:hypothetical protein
VDVILTKAQRPQLVAVRKKYFLHFDKEAPKIIDELFNEIMKDMTTTYFDKDEEEEDEHKEKIKDSKGLENVITTRLHDNVDYKDVQIKFHTEDKLVSLIGTVSTQEQKKKAQDLVESVITEYKSGFIVKNHILVK